MRRWLLALPFVGLLLIVVMSCAITGQLFFNDCLWWECAPARSFEVIDLALPAALFPPNAQVNSIHPLSEGVGAKETGAMSIYWDKGNGIAVYDVLRFATTKKAVVEFAGRKNSFFYDRYAGIPWETSLEIKYTSSIANEFFTACGNIANTYRCGVIARYDEYVLFFNATIDEQMTHKKFEQSVIFIDGQIANHLGR